MCMWVHAMDQYGDIYEEVKPRMATVEVCVADKIILWAGSGSRCYAFLD